MGNAVEEASLGLFKSLVKSLFLLLIARKQVKKSHNGRGVWLECAKLHIFCNISNLLQGREKAFSKLKNAG